MSFSQLSSVALLACVAASLATAQQPTVTLTQHVGPILQEKCQACHSPGSIAPMSLITYKDVKEYADEIKSHITDRVMPPWHLDKTVGIHDFKNDRSLSDDQIATIVKWI